MRVAATVSHSSTSILSSTSLICSDWARLSSPYHEPIVKASTSFRQVAACCPFLLRRIHHRTQFLASSTTSRRFFSHQDSSNEVSENDGGVFGGFGGPHLNITEDDSELLPRNVQSMLKNDFFDFPSKRCSLCNESIVGNFQSHANFPTHQARLGIVQRALTGLAGPPDLLSDRWWLLLHESTSDGTLGFGRIPALSHRNKRMRRRRVCYLLDFLQRRGFIRESLGIFRGGASLSTSSSSAGSTQQPSTQPHARGRSFQSHVIASQESNSLNGINTDSTSFHRSIGFERFEMIGDNVVKFMIPDRLFRMFPPEDGGPTGQIALCQQMLDSNEGLLKIYDYLDLDRIIGVRLPNSKSKADVVEALFGELQCFLWATEMRPSECGGLDTSGDMWHVGADGFLLSPELRYARAVINHLVNEIAHCVLVWACESALENARDFINTHYEACSRHVQNVVGHKRKGIQSAKEKNGKRKEGKDLFNAQAAYMAYRQIPTAFPGHPTSSSASEFYSQSFLPPIRDHLPTVAEKAQRMSAARALGPGRITAPYFSRIQNRVAPALHTGSALCLFLKSDQSAQAFCTSLQSNRVLFGLSTKAPEENGISHGPTMSPAPFALPTVARPSIAHTGCIGPPADSIRAVYCQTIMQFCNTDAMSWNWDSWWEKNHKVGDSSPHPISNHLRLSASPTGTDSMSIDLSGIVLSLPSSMELLDAPHSLAASS